MGLRVIGGLPAPTISYAGHGYQTGNRTSVSIGSVPFGTAHPRRTLLIHTAANPLLFVGNVPGLTVDGVAATDLSAALGSTTRKWFAISKPTGVSGTIAYTSSDTLFYGAVHVWAVYNLKAPLVADDVGALFSGLGNNSVNRSIVTKNKGCIGLFGDDVSGGTTGPFTWTNASEVADAAGYGSGTGLNSPYTAAQVEQNAGLSRSVTLATGDECTIFWCSLR